ncbi:amidohydrolase family protein [Nocardioides sp. YIM 152315]|uniref:N-acetylglucosamine-6-phosphate deacetylase n=1 Tax=Nocardioides sp. YIM 152315 TaxID=3031760 RepID=UPI0023DA0149|nr:amidohydrolase family protein [Nocardioides sp. YIM 152315]MDF1602612.1 amidohydrolase family protein [Nocardioides sp. YIM 152315]
MTSALSGALVTPTEILREGVVEVRGDRLGYVGPRAGWTGSAPEPAGILVPGYIDLHCHGGGGANATDAAGVAAVATHHLGRGTTSMLASLVSGPTETITEQASAIADVVESGTTSIVGGHLEGPWLSPARCGAHDPRVLATPDEASAAAWLAAGRGTLRMVTLAPELTGALPVGSLLEDADVLVAYGHTDADAASFTTALRARRAPLVTHLFNGMAPLHHRAPGAAGAALRELARGAASVELIADGVHLADETVAMVFDVAPDGHVLLVSDAMAAAGLPDGDFELGPLAVRVVDGVARLDGGSLAGGTSHLGEIVSRCVTTIGLDPVAVVAAASSTPAALLGLSDRGRLAPGLRADLVSLGAEWQVDRVMRGGAWVV